MDKYSIDWKTIRSLRGSKATGFEELCGQLARADIPKGAQFTRIGTPDSGVECLCVLPDKSEWGWQAKYLDNLGNTQWSEIDASVKTALDKHPKLVKYTICIPYDRPDSRIEGRKSALEKWNEHVEKWSKWASERNMVVEFIYFGSFELINCLTQPKHTGLLRFWFDKDHFDIDWFKSKLDDSILAAGPRYTPENNISLPIIQDFDFFSRTQPFFDIFKIHSKIIRKQSTFLKYYKSKDLSLEIITKVDTLLSNLQDLISQLGEICYQPIGDLPFSKVTVTINKIEKTASQLVEPLQRQIITYEEIHKNQSKDLTYFSNPIREFQINLDKLLEAIADLSEDINHAIKSTKFSILILDGVAGIGKTHLLCDFATKRLQNNQPTILLLGQRFRTNDVPWIQISHLLDLQGMTLQEFVGALEASAQTANSRAIIIIDAINEGQGREIWPAHLNNFIKTVTKSPWISIILSVRTSYEEYIVPEEIRNSCVKLTHFGFADSIYDAARNYFKFYNIEYPSVPLLAPEFHNPLFLKTICKSLSTNGLRRIPRGLQGITKIFSFYLESINSSLANTLAFNPKSNIIMRALSEFANKLVETGKSWLSLSIAEDLINSFLPGKNFHDSLFYGLIDEGILTEDIVKLPSGNQEVVYIAFDRFSDHLIISKLIDKYIDTQDLANPFNIQELLSALQKNEMYLAPGKLEALCIQIPERTNKEFVTLYPKILSYWSIENAFKQSIVWRDPKAIFAETFDVINKLTRNESELLDTLDTLLLVTCIPEHPYNALFLHNRLWKDSMDVRDSWWTTSLHKLWGNHSSINQIIDWGLSITPSNTLEKDVVDLISITLSWMLSSSNRFIRDRATKALVCLLTDRPSSVLELLKNFINVNDPYILERIFAVVYGVVMRCNLLINLDEIGVLVYKNIFEKGAPPANILLRDYARGIIERIIALGVKVPINLEKIRPPYKSLWPKIPRDNEIKKLFPNQFNKAYKFIESDWARDRIFHSVMNDDFAYYIIGTNGYSNEWLSLKLTDPEWSPPLMPEKFLEQLISDFDKEEINKWKSYASITQSILKEISLEFSKIYDKRDEENYEIGNLQSSITIEIKPKEFESQKIKNLKRKQDQALEKLNAVLSPAHLEGLNKYFFLKEHEYEISKEPRFDLKIIQNYILWRVLDLGWTSEKFGNFDKNFMISYNRSSSKAERIGKKYQWIAYYEILAYISDHFQFLENFHSGNRDKKYLGPWQLSVRNIDPTCILPSIPGGTTWEGHRPGWWDTNFYSNWNHITDSEKWVKNYEELPKIETLLSVNDPSSNSEWINLRGYFNWMEPTPPNLERNEIEEKEIWYSFQSYFIKNRDIKDFLIRAQENDFQKINIPSSENLGEMFLGEYIWSPAYTHLHKKYLEENENLKVKLNNQKPIVVIPSSTSHRYESGSFDCSISDSFHLHLPSAYLLNELNLKWAGNGGDFVNKLGEVVSFDPTISSEGPDSLLITKKEILNLLKLNELNLVWLLTGEKQVIGPGVNPKRRQFLSITGTIVLSEDGFHGFLKYKYSDYSDDSYPPKNDETIMVSL